MLDEKVADRNPYTKNELRSKKANEFISEFRDKQADFYKNPLNSEKFYLDLLDFIKKASNINLDLYRPNFLHRRLYYRIMRLDIPTYSKYLDYIRTHDGESSKFIESFTIHVTEFFRDREPFNYLESTLLQKIDEQKQSESDKTIRIFSAPCSSGEEPYSLAIIVDALKKKNLLKCNVEILASDIDQGVLDVAAEGIYPIGSLKKISDDCITRNFRKLSDTHFQIKPNLKQYITFFKHDLLKAIPFKNIDLVLCRNFLIYISKGWQNDVIDNIIKSMKPGSYLMLGKTEGFPLISTKNFISENLKEHIYRLSR